MREAVVAVNIFIPRLLKPRGKLQLEEAEKFCAAHFFRIARVVEVADKRGSGCLSTDYEEPDWPDPWSYNDLAEDTPDGFYEDIDLDPKAPDDLSEYIDEYAIEV